MARSFLASSSQYLVGANAVTDYPFTIAARFNTTNPTIGGDQSIMYVGSNANDSDIFGIAIHNATGKAASVINASGAGFVITDVGSALSANTWYSLVFTGTSATDRTVYLNGSGTSVNDTTSRTFNTGGNPFTNSWIGTYRAVASYFDGLIAESAVWNAVLTPGEIDSLAKGYSPAFIRPANLASYWPLIGRASPEIDIMGFIPMTLNNTPTTGAHPRVIMPSSQRMRRMTTAAGAATFPWAWAQGSNLPVLGTGNY